MHIANLNKANCLYTSWWRREGGKSIANIHIKLSERKNKEEGQPIW